MARKPRTETFELLCGHLVAAQDGAEPTLLTQCTIREMDHMTDRSLADRSSDFLAVIGRHIVAIGDIVDRDKLDREVIPNLMKGDLDYILLKLRILSLGGDYTFQTSCGRRDCAFVTEQTLDLTSLDAVDMPDPTVREVTYVTDDNECTLIFRPYLASDLLPMSDIMSGGTNEISLLLGLRLVSINGVTPADDAKSKGRACKTADQRATIAARMLEQYQINHREREHIRKELDKIAGYPKLVFQARCDKCSAVWMQRMEITPTFLVSSAAGS